MTETPENSKPAPTEMRIDPTRAAQLLSNLTSITQRISQASTSNSSSSSPVRLVAVSKLKPPSDILALHNPPTSNPPGASHLHFGENYAQELAAKAAVLPHSIRWHFIGQLQSNKCRGLAAGVPNLWCVASVDGVGKARGLERGRAELEAKLKEEGASASGGEGKGGLGEGPEGMERLRVCVQVNTSGESSKSGCEPDAAAALVRQIRDECPHLHVQGLMTIGAIARSEAAGKGEENEDFKVLKQVRERVVKELGMEVGELELSMGMSGDFEDAVSQGSSEVRVGSGIFGDRERRADAVVKGEAQEQK